MKNLPFENFSKEEFLEKSTDCSFNDIKNLSIIFLFPLIILISIIFIDPLHLEFFQSFQFDNSNIKERKYIYIYNINK